MAAAANNKAIVDTLSTVLADSYALYAKTQAYHWNVEGPNFFGLHNMFEEQYTDLAGAIDEIAERIRAIGAYAPGGLSAFRSLSKIKDPAPGGTPAMKMVEDLANENDAIIAQIKKAVEQADSANDQATVDLLNARTQAHEKNAWMLRSVLK